MASVDQSHYIAASACNPAKLPLALIQYAILSLSLTDDHNRVQMAVQDGADGTDYVNASFVDVSSCTVYDMYTQYSLTP